MRRLGRRKIDDAAVVRDARERGRWRTNGHAIRRRRECEQWREYTHLPRVGARHTPTPHTDEETSTRIDISPMISRGIQNYHKAI